MPDDILISQTPSSSESFGKRLVLVYNTLLAERAPYDTLWKDQANFILPRRLVDFQVKSKASRLTDTLWDSTAIRAVERLASGLYYMSTPPDRRWFSIETAHNEAKDIEEINAFYSEGTTRLYEVLGISNFNQIYHEFLMELGAFSTANIIEEQSTSTLLNFTSIPTGSYVAKENNEGLIDFVFREFTYSGRQLMQEFGKESLPEKIQRNLFDSQNNPTDHFLREQFKVVQAVFPQNHLGSLPFDGDPALNLPFHSVYFLKDEAFPLRFGGYHEFPFHVGRFLKSSSETYGRGPADRSLPEIKELNAVERDLTKAIEKAVNPPVKASAKQRFKINNDARGTTYWDTSNPLNEPKEWLTNARVDWGTQRAEFKRSIIREAFFNDLIDVLADRKNMTATEVIERIESRLISFAPTYGRLEAEVLTPLLTRSFKILSRIPGALPRQPDALAEFPSFKITYQSRLSLAFKMLQNRSLLNVIETVAPLIETHPEILDNLNVDEAFREIARNSGLPHNWLNPPKIIQTIRQQRAAFQAAQLAAS